MVPNHAEGNEIQTASADSQGTEAQQSAREELRKMREEAFQLASDIIEFQPTVVDENELSGLIRASYEGDYGEIDRWFARRLAEIKRHWKGVLQIPSHRPPNIKTLRQYIKAAELRARKHLSWAQAARVIDPRGYKRHPQQTIERIRKGVGSLKPKPRGNTALFKIALFFKPRKSRALALDFAIPIPNEQIEKRINDLALEHVRLVERAGWNASKVLREVGNIYLVTASHALESGTPGQRLRRAKRLLKQASVHYLVLAQLISEVKAEREIKQGPQ